jgi:menaquinone-9 beta-reductase
MSDFDVVVVGGGPAGSWLSYRLATAGAKVAVIDGSHPREKPCGGGVSARALARLTPLVRAGLSRGVAIAGGVFRAGSETAAVSLGQTAPDTPALFVTCRRDFDAALLSAAVAAGAEHVAQRVTSVDRATAGWTVAAGTRTLRSPWLIGADGANSLVRRRVQTAFPRSDISVASGYYIRDKSSSEIDIDFMQSPPGYLWSFPRPNHLAVGMCGQANETSSEQLFVASREWIRRRWPDVGEPMLTRYSWPIPSLSEEALLRETPAGDRWLLIGDAAGLVDPITREGICFALESAELAAQALAGPRTVAAYSEAVKGSIHGELRRAARMKTRFFAPGFTRLLIRSLQRSEPIRQIMAGLVSGHFGYHGLRRRLLRTGEVGLALEYLLS